MSLTVEKVHEINNKQVNNVTNPVKEEQIFNYVCEAPADSVVIKKLWSENTKSLLFNAVKKMGIKNYTPSILKNDNTAIKKAQSHLIDLLKYYEGDRKYYYEAYTSPYKDKYGTYTCGFGELTNKYLSQDKAYEILCNKLVSYTNEVKNYLNKKIGDDTYEKLPDSIKEGLIDLCYNKGLGTISTNKNLINAIKTKDYSKVVSNLTYVYSNKSGVKKEEDAGLYRRSLCRAILSSRDLKGKELEEAKKEIERIYNKAVECHKKANAPLVELNKIYEQFKSGKISSSPISAEAFKIKIDETFKGKGLWSIAQSLYKSIDNTEEISFKEFYNEILALNGDSTDIKVGQDLKIPCVKGLNLDKLIAPEAKKSENNKQEEKKNVEKPGFLKRVWNKIKGFFKCIGRAIGKFFSSDENQDVIEKSAVKVAKTPFEKVLQNGKITQDGDFQIISMDYKVQKGDNLWNLSRTYGISEEILCNYNNIEDKNSIKAGQILKIQKLGYKVEKGDNLYQIAKKFGLTVEILKDLNNIEDVNMIKAGEMLEIPGFIYNVKPKDTLSKISDLVGVSIDDLRKINNLPTDTIMPNQKIKIVYNDSDFAVSADKKKVCYDSKTNTKKEVIDMAGTANLANRPLLQKKRKINGQVMATRHVFNPTKQGSLSGKTIIVNAGHGYSQAGTDCGALGIGKVEDEWLINYDNAMRLKDRLCAKGAKVIFLQGHVNVVTREIPKAENKADMFISVHVNSCAKNTQDRTQIYTYDKDSAVNNKSKKLSGLMEKNFDSWIPKHEKINDKDKFILKQDDKRVQDYAQSMEANYAVVRTAESSQKIPSVLWEVAFMISPKGRERMSNPSLMNSYSDIMVQSVEEYFKA